MTNVQAVVRVPAGYRVGPWRVTKPLASGSWSSVYAAERDPDDPPTGDKPGTAALKFVPTGTLTNRQLAFMAEMTQREVSVGRKVAHPRLARLYETHVIDDPDDTQLDGATVLVLELADRSAAAQLDTVDGGLPDAPRIVTEICAGLAHLHTAGWVHGDLKPSNVLLMADGSVRLADFGLAAEIDGTHAYLPPGGTADYMPPERADEDLGRNGVAIRQTALSARLEEMPLDASDHTGEERALLDDHIVAYRLDGPLFFGAAHTFLLELSELREVRVVVLRLSRVATLDATGASVLADTGRGSRSPCTNRVGTVQPGSSCARIGSCSRIEAQLWSLGA